MNNIEIIDAGNSVVVSVIDITTTAYFLTESMTLEEHKEAGGSDV